MSGLILPDHVAKAVKAKKGQAAPASPVPAPEALTEPTVADAYVPEVERSLDPTKIPGNVMERLPQPTGWRVLILPYRGPKQSKGGVLYADETVERNSLTTVVGYVLAIGPEAYNDKEKFPTGPWCKKGDWVMIGRYAGARFRIDGGEVRIINDDEVIATIMDPADVLHV
jgi:co-chaperonin GroES (HSP10)